MTIVSQIIRNLRGLDRPVEIDFMNTKIRTTKENSSSWPYKFTLIHIEACHLAGIPYWEKFKQRGGSLGASEDRQVDKILEGIKIKGGLEK